jgi:transcriptional regulator with XRE-family HTH domain
MPRFRLRLLIMPICDIEQLSRELVRHLRGRRSQLAFSRHLGFASNVYQTWELGKRYPKSSDFLSVAHKSGLPVKHAVASFLQHHSHWGSATDATSPSAVTALLLDLRGDRRISELSIAAGANRATLSRWLSGAGEPRLPDLLRLVQAATHRLLEFAAIFAPPELLSATRVEWENLELQRQLAYELPMSHAVLRALELRRYQELKTHREGFIAALLGISVEDERAYLSALARARQIRKRKGLWHITQVLTVDTRRQAAPNQRLKQYWASLGAERTVHESGNGLFCYNLFTVSEPDYQRLREMQLAYFEALRAVVGRSEPADRVVVTNLQLFALDGPEPRSTGGAQQPDRVLRAPAQRLPRRRS